VLTEANELVAISIPSINTASEIREGKNNFGVRGRKGRETILHYAVCILHLILPARRHFNKEQTPLGGLLDPNPRFHGGCFGV